MNKIFLDYNSTTPLSEDVLSAMLPYFTEKYGNPSSTHSFGQEALHAINKARLQVSKLIGCKVDEITFTSGGTESNNLALSGIGRLNRTGKNHIITSSVEHSSIFNQCKQMEEDGFDITYLPVDKDGKISVKDLENSITEKTGLVSIILANNETGTIQNIKEIAKIATANFIPTHTDAVQAIAKIPVSVEELGVDLLTLSGHKIYGPKGIGALYVTRGLHLLPLFQGGGQEKRRRSGTENVPGIVGLGKACEIATNSLNKNIDYLSVKRDRLEQGILASIPFANINGVSAERVPNTTNISFSGMEADTLIIKLAFNGIAVSSGSACGATSRTASRTLTAMALPARELYSSLRFSIGINTTNEEIDYTINCIKKICLKQVK